MSHAFVRVGAAVLLAVGVGSLADVPHSRGQDKPPPPAAAAEPAAKPTAFPEPTQFDPKPFPVKFGDDALAVAYSPDGTLLAVGCGDKVVRLFDPSTGKLVGTMTGHSDAVAAVAFSRDGSKLATASFDKTSDDEQTHSAVGTLTLFIDTDEVGRAEIMTQPGHLSLTGDGLSVGRDSASPVADYEAPFHFTGGTIDRVVVDVSGDHFVDHEMEVLAYLARD